MPKSVDQAYALDENNDNTIREYAISKEINNACPAFFVNEIMGYFADWISACKLSHDI